MAEPTDKRFDERLTAVERAVIRLSDEALRSRVELDAARMDAEAARTLAAAADRDVSELRAQLRGHTRTLNALRETQLEHRAECAGHHAEFRGFRAETRAGFATVNAGMARITSLLEGLADGRGGA